MELGRIEGVDRPAVITTLPRSDGGQLVLLDLGANVDCKPSHLGQFAVMGHVFAQDVLQIETPRVGLLSNGEEEGKGNEQVRAAMPVLSSLPIEFIGPVEPNFALHGGCEVVVCDGFVGNVMLKSVEAAIGVAGKVLKEEILRRIDAKLGARLREAHSSATASGPRPAGRRRFFRRERDGLGGARCSGRGRRFVGDQAGPPCG